MKTIQFKIKQNRSRKEWKIEKKNQIGTRYNFSPNIWLQLVDESLLVRFQEHIDLVPYSLGDEVICISFPTCSKTCKPTHMIVKINWKCSLQTILVENKSSHCKLKSFLKQWTYLFTLPTLIHCVVSWSSKVMIPMKPCRKLIN